MVNDQPSLKGSIESVEKNDENVSGVRLPKAMSSFNCETSGPAVAPATSPSSSSSASLSVSVSAPLSVDNRSISAGRRLFLQSASTYSLFSASIESSSIRNCTSTDNVVQGKDDNTSSSASSETSGTSDTDSLNIQLRPIPCGNVSVAENATVNSSDHPHDKVDKRNSETTHYVFLLYLVLTSFNLIKSVLNMVLSMPSFEETPVPQRWSWSTLPSLLSQFYNNNISSITGITHKKQSQANAGKSRFIPLEIVSQIKNHIENHTIPTDQNNSLVSQSSSIVKPLEEIKPEIASDSVKLNLNFDKKSLYELMKVNKRYHIFQ
jgi:hypothetical protein